MGDTVDDVEIIKMAATEVRRLSRKASVKDTAWDMGTPAKAAYFDAEDTLDTCPTLCDELTYPSPI
jgi:hypothetical protein